jgi:Fe2+ or Zn2+ uptake regulation protein
MQSVPEMVEAYRSAGRKVTPQRHAVLAALADNDSHPTAEAVHAAVTASMPTVSLRTVYSVLGELVALGEVHQLDLGTGSARFDPNVEPHHHLVCDRCGRVRDVLVDHSDVRPVAAESRDFHIDTTEIVFRGRCVACAAVS